MGCEGIQIFPGISGIWLQTQLVSEGGVPFWLTRFGDTAELATGSYPGVNRLMMQDRQRSGAFWLFQLKPSAKIFPGLVWCFAANKDG
jgi:hypothetical protein